MNHDYSSSVFNIMNFGADPSGLSPSTSAFASALGACSESGGGAVFVPAGTFLTGPIELKSNTHLHLAAGAVLKFSQNPDDYPVIHARWEGAECTSYMPMIFARSQQNICVTGFGLLDGQGQTWWKRFREGKLMHARPRLIGFEDCTGITLEGIRLTNSPAWTVNPIRCQNVTIDNITITNPADSPNTDGINPDSSKNVRISNCHVDVGDDCITIKSGTEKSTDRVSCENITISNCTLVHGHGGIVIGSEMSGDVRNVVISNCVFEGTDRGIRMKTRRGRGGIVEDILINNLVMNHVMCPIVMHQYYFCGEGGKDASVQDRSPHPVSPLTPQFRSIRFSNIIAKNAHAAAAFIFGLPEMPIRDISLSHVSITLAGDAAEGTPAMMSGLLPMKKAGILCTNVEDIRFDHVNVCGHEGPPILLSSATGVRATGCNFAVTDQ